MDWDWYYCSTALNPMKAVLFDFAESLYDQCIAVQLIAFLRAEAKYDGLDALIAQIARDCDDARQILAGTPYVA